MTESSLLGSLPSENRAKENAACREIVSEIVRYGVNDRQILFIIRTLAHELEDMDECREIVGCVDSLQSSKELHVSGLGSTGV